MGPNQEVLISIVIPVFNEVNTILEVLRLVRKTQYNKEIIIVDDGSTDGTRELLEDVNFPEVKIIYNEKNRGKGYSIREGITHAKGDVIIIQDADLEYYPDEYHLLLEPILKNKADAVFGSRFSGSRRVFNFYHHIGNKVLNLMVNILLNFNFSDVMSGFKAIKRSVLMNIGLHADNFSIEVEMAAKIAMKKYRIFEVPVSYNGREYSEGKKLKWSAFFSAIYWLIKVRFSSNDIGSDTLFRMRAMKNNNRLIFDRIKAHLGSSILEIGSGIGNISRLMMQPKRKLILTDYSESYIEYLSQAFIGNPGVKVLLHDIQSQDISVFEKFNIDTAVCINVLEHIEKDVQVIKNIHNILNKDGCLVLLVPSMKALYGTLDKELGHFRRYDICELKNMLEGNGFIVKQIYYHNMFSSIGWYVNGRIFKRKIIPLFQVSTLDKILPAIMFFEKYFKLPFGLSIICIAVKKSETAEQLERG